ncbi:hypothetical protein LCGC14_0812120 [marine sediment metagenome]|uniref:Uncharacterized protein n=1 Tax=marine sediment metagenome TaxID=412755 RepID=A0A0F9PQU5_9ZZZZ
MREFTDDLMYKKALDLALDGKLGEDIFALAQTGLLSDVEIYDSVSKSLQTYIYEQTRLDSI